MQLLAFVFALTLLPSVPVAAAIHTVNCAAGPFFTINGAVAAAANGDTIMIEPCAAPYNENVLIAGFTGLHLVGVSPLAAGDFGAQPAGVGVFALNPLSVVNGAGLAGACFDVQNSTDIKIQNLRVTNCNLGGIRIRSSKQVLVLANRIVQNPNVAVLAINTDDLQISSNLIAITGVEGVLLDTARTSTIADNFIVRAGAAGIRLNGGASNRIDNNNVRSSGTEGLLVSGVEARVERNSFNGSGAGTDIVLVATSTNADVLGNSVPAGIVDAGAGTEAANNF